MKKLTTLIATVFFMFAMIACSDSTSSSDNESIPLNGKWEFFEKMSSGNWAYSSDVQISISGNKGSMAMLEDDGIFLSIPITSFKMTGKSFNFNFTEPEGTAVASVTGQIQDNDNFTFSAQFPSGKIDYVKAVRIK